MGELDQQADAADIGASVRGVYGSQDRSLGETVWNAPHDGELNLGSQEEYGGGIRTIGVLPGMGMRVVYPVAGIYVLAKPRRERRIFYPGVLDAVGLSVVTNG